HLVVDQEVDVRWRIILGDACLMGHLQVTLPEVNLLEPVDKREDEDHSWSFGTYQPAEGEDDHSLILPDDSYGVAQECDDDDDNDAHHDVVDYLASGLEREAGWVYQGSLLST